MCHYYADWLAWQNVKVDGIRSRSWAKQGVSGMSGTWNDIVLTVYGFGGYEVIPDGHRFLKISLIQL